MRLWKLTSSTRTTYNGLLWTPGEWQRPLPGSRDLCTGDWYHAYLAEDPWVPLIMNSNHAGFVSPLLWRAEGRGNFLDDRGCKCGFSEMRIVGKPVRVTPPTYEQLRAFAVWCAGTHANEQDQDQLAGVLAGEDLPEPLYNSAAYAVYFVCSTKNVEIAAYWAGVAASSAASFAEQPEELLADACAWARAVA